MARRFAADLSVVLGALLLLPALAGAAPAQRDDSVAVPVPDSQALATLPFDKRYEQLTPRQRRQVKAQYESLRAGDEPPFPALGLGPMYRAIALVEEPAHRGRDLSLDVFVDRDGRVVHVDVLKSPSDAMARYASAVAKATLFKPAVCGGEACAMSFPVRIRFERPF